MNRRRHAIRSALLVACVFATLMVAATNTVGAQDQSLPEEIVGSTDPIVSTVADDLPWGVIGIGNFSHVSTNLRVPVFAIQEIGDRIFVGGMFAQVQNGSGGTIVNQPFLAAFDKDTGEYISDWTPTLDASVYALGATSDGKLIVGGDFTNINGDPWTAALAALDPITGDVITTWRSHLERPWSSNEPVVRAIEVVNGWVYAGGNFSHQNSFASRTRMYKAVKVRESDGILDVDWKPQVTGAGIWALAVAPDASRVTLGGYHSAINASPETEWIGVVNGTTGATIPGLIYEKAHPSSGHVQGISDTGSKLYYTGSQHYIFQHDTTTWAREEGTTYVWGGDGQAIEIAEGFIYNACHCFLQTAYTDSYTWPNPSPGSTAHDVNGISAHTQDGFDYVDAFQPEIYYENGDGPWALEYDSRGCLWVGGDVFRLDDDQPYRWARGFTRLCQDDAEAPTTPTGLFATLTGINQDDVDLTWLPSSDNRGVASYEIYRDGTLIGTSVDTSYSDTGITGATVYRVRAVDERGNKSATSDPVTASPPTPGAALIAAGSTWAYLDDGSNQGTAWRQIGFDDATWSSGPGQLGFGDGDEGTVIASGNVQYYFRHEFNVADLSATALDVELLADDGAVVYLNGTELLREQMPTGPLGFPAWPTGWKGSATENLYTTYTVPADELVLGPNVLAVSVHNASSNNSDLGFDLRLTSSTETPPPAATEVVAAGASWQYLDNGSNQGTAWRAPGFDDSGWATGDAEFGYGDNDEATVIEAGSPRHITHYFRTSFTVPDANAFTSLDLGLLRDDGAVVYLNDVEIVRDNMPAGPIAFDTLATAYAAGSGERTFHPFVLPADALVNGVNVIAVELHSRDIGSRDMSFDLSLTISP